jgi:hypothetical protein
VEEGDSGQAVSMQARILLCKVVQAQVAHRARGIAKKHQQQRMATELLERDRVTVDIEVEKGKT